MLIDDYFELDLNTRKLCTPSVKNDDNSTKLLCDYYESLSQQEKNDFERLSERFCYYLKMGQRRYKITKSAIYIANRIKKELGISCYPYIEKIATKSWSTSGGTFAWCMKLLVPNDIHNEIYSYKPAKEYLLKNTVISIGECNGFNGVLSVDTIK